ncbi:MAG: hypothetical protein GXO32_03805 [Crenarchaeota archaeon]|nr:hypothetical protein [Thermoproteota archaeon]
MMIGYAERTITPPLGTELSGFASRSSGCRCVESDLLCRCVSLEASGGLFTIAVLDLLGVPMELSESVRRRVGDDRFVLVATHTHSGPSLSKAPESYINDLVDRIARCIEESRRLSASARYASSSSIAVPYLVYNRRDPQRGAIDPYLRVVALESASSVELLLVQYTCHAVVLGPDNLCVSPDWPGALARELATLSGVPRIAVVNGCCGNINPFTPSTRLEKPYDRRGATFEELRSFARALGGAAYSLLEARWRFREPALERAVIVERRVRLPLRSCAVDLEGLEERARMGDAYARWLLERHRMVERLKEMHGSYVPARVLCIALSRSTALVVLPSEVFVEHQRWIVSRSPFGRTVVVAYAEPYIGYIPTREAYAEGGYEVEYPVSIVEPGAGEELRDAALDALVEAFAAVESLGG